MTREKYKGCILVARVEKLRDQPIWHARIAIDRLVNGYWQEVRITPGLHEQEFTCEQDALAAALAHGRTYVDSLSR